MMFQAAKAGKVTRLLGACLLAALPLLTLLGVSTAVLAQGSARVRLSASVLNLGPGNDVTIDIIVENSPAIYGADVQLSFDPAQLEVVDADANTPGIQLAPGNFIPDTQAFILHNQANNDTGTFRYALTLLHPASPIQGAGILARITLRAKTPGWAEIAIDQIQFGTQTGATISPPRNPHHASFVISPINGSAPVAVTFTNTSSSDASAWLWDFGDGATSTAHIPTHTYLNAGRYYATLTLTDTQQHASTALHLINLTNTAPRVAVDAAHIAEEGLSITLTGVLFDPDTQDAHTATVNWGDSNVTSATVHPDMTISASHTYTAEASYVATVEVCDAYDSCGRATTSITVINVAPYIGEITAPTAPLLINTPFTASASFTDSGILDTHTAIWNWDDGTTSSGTVTASNGTGHISGSHIYTAPGVYNLQLTVMDNAGGFGRITFQYVVIYDPDGGSVTGVGRFKSPPGAYVEDTTLTGRAHFGFFSRYKSGATVPRGRMRFYFWAGDFRFKAETYDWLAVFGARAWFQGNGQINGVSGYKFLITAIDGHVDPDDEITEDLFRIKVWYEEDNGTEVIVYDNGFGSTDFSEDWATAIDAGAVTIWYR